MSSCLNLIKDHKCLMFNANLFQKKKDKEVKKKEKEEKHEKNTKEKEGKSGGIKKKENEKSEKHEKKNELEGKGGESKKKGIEKDEKAKDKKKEEKHGKVKAQEPKKEFSDFSEYYIKDYYKSVADSLNLFKDDALVHKPGEKSRGRPRIHYRS